MLDGKKPPPVLPREIRGKDSPHKFGSPIVYGGSQRGAKKGQPWQTKIDGQNYIQYSSTFALAIDKIWQELELIYGQPDGMFCSLEDVFSEAFGGNAISYVQPPASTVPTISPGMEATVIAEVNSLLTEIAESYTPTPFGTPDLKNWPFIETTDIPLAEWNEIPVMPEAIAGIYDGIGYIYS